MTTTPSIRDVAREAGVSITTVSHAIHGTRHVAGATRARIHEAAARLGYQPNRLARGLRTQRTQTVGMLVMDFRNPAVAPYVEGAESVLDAAGYSLVVASAHGGADATTGRLERFRQLRADGLIINVQSSALLGCLEDIAGDRPVVLANAFADDILDAAHVPSRLAAVVVDEEAASFKATSHLLGLGHRRVGLVQRGPAFWNPTQRLHGYRRALEAAEQPFDPALVVEHEPQDAPADSVVRRLMSLEDPPTAVYVAPDRIARRLVAAVLDAGIAVPAQLALAVYAVGNWMEVARPRMTAIEPPAYEVGVTAARALLHLLEQGEPDRPADEPLSQHEMVTVVQAPLVVRESCGASSAPDPPTPDR